MALLFEHFWGNPSSPWYPAHSFIGFSQVIQSLLWKDSKLRGIFVWFLTIFASLCVFITLWYHLAYGTTWFSIVLQALLLWVSLNWDSLNKDLERTTFPSYQLGNQHVLAKETSYAIIAPLLYFSLFGVLGAWVYRMTNILMKCWNTSDEKHLHFGWFAQKTHIIVNFLPLNLTRLFMCFQEKPERSNPPIPAFQQQKLTKRTVNVTLTFMILSMLGAAWTWHYLG